MNDEFTNQPPPFVIHHSSLITPDYLWLFCRRKQKSHKLKGVAQSCHAAPAIVKLRFCGS
jgi:hypothetical protein